ncbi:hypothetical protein BS17DRAFT_807512 [Gyrodon lividus]|nr:hypothetical protein BS17DRAFT_807512 [Gyrodon lividus]
MTMDGALAARTLIEIAQASQQVITVATSYSKRVKSFTDSPRIRLQGQLQRIVATSEFALGVVNHSSSFSNDPDIDRLLVEWLASDEPKVCLETLKDMESSFKDEPRPFLSVRPFVRQEDVFRNVATLFNTRRANFHFLLTTDLWNHGKEVRRQQEVAQAHTLPIDGSNVLMKGARDSEQGQTQIENDVKGIKQSQEVIQDPHIVINEGPMGIEQAVEVIARDESDVCAGVATTSNVTTVGDRLGVDGTDRRKKVDRKDVDKVLKWLGGLDCTGKHEATCALRQVNTCTWLPRTDKYKSWRGGDISFLWMEGKPGAGKSVLASSVIDDLRCALRDGEVLAFFYCDFRNEQSTSAAEVMRSLLTQLLRLANVNAVDYRDVVPELVQRRARGAAPPADMKLLTCLVRCAAKLHQRPFIVIDALDESKDVEKLLDALKELNDGHIRLFVTSRPERIIREVLSDLPSISLQAMTSAVSADMEQHIMVELDSRRWLRILQQGLKWEIRSALLEAADGMFRWIQCQIDTLAQCTSAGEIRTALESLPIGLDETYKRILVMIDRNELQGTLVRRALVWLVAALQPLRLPDVMEALKIDLESQALDDDIVPTNETILLDACGSLVTHDVWSGIVTLSHFSVKEYLMGERIRTLLPRYYINGQDAHEQLARLCMCYMSLELGHSWESIDKGPSSRRNAMSSDEAESPSDETESSDIRPLSRTLLSYALSDGFDHLSHVGPGQELVLGGMMTLQANIQQHPSKWKKIRKMFSSDHKFRWTNYVLHWSNLKHDFMLYILVGFASVSLLETFLDRAVPTPKDGTNPLLYAAYFKKAQHARVLLSRGASLQDIGWVVDGSHQCLPLEFAIKYMLPEWVELFLEKGNRVPEHLFFDVLSTVPLRITRSVLQTDQFAEWATTDRATLMLHSLLQRSPNLGESDLMVDITRRLVQVGCDPELSISSGKTPLHLAVTEHHISVVKYMLSIDIPLPPDILLTAARALMGRARMMHLLIDKGADIHACTSNGDGVLYVAMDHEIDDALETAKVLVDAGCDPVAYNPHGKTPLHLVATRGLVSIVEYMLSMDVPLPPDILLAAVESPRDRAEIVYMLIGKGADIHACTSDGDSLLHIAIDQDASEEWFDVEHPLDTVKILVCLGCDPTISNSHGKTPLHFAVARGHVLIVEYLLSRGVPLPFDILLAAMDLHPYFQQEITNMLIHHGADQSVLGFMGIHMF